MLKSSAKLAKIARTGRISDWLADPAGRLPVSCTTFVVQDGMEDEDGIEDSWRFVSHALRNGAGCAVHLSQLRPKGTNNGKGLEASGPVSFGTIYSKLNEILRRGGKFKNGAVVLHLDYDHPDAIAFIEAPRSEFPWAKRCLNVDQSFLKKASPALIAAAIKAISAGNLWLIKMRTDRNGARIYGNVCVSGDTIVHTTEGPCRIADLQGKPFVAIVNGKEHPSSDRGAWSNGFRQTYLLETKEGYSVRATADHKIMTTNGWRKLDSLFVGDTISLHRHWNDDACQWKGQGSYDEGWLIGWLLADGTYSNDQSVRLDFYGSKQCLLDGALSKLSSLDNYLSGDHYSKLRTGSASKITDSTSVNSTGLARVALEYGIAHKNKTATELLEETSSEFQRGFLEAYFSADGTVGVGHANGNGKIISVTSVNLRNLTIIQRMLLRLGIRSRIWKEKYNGGMTVMPDGKGGHKPYQTQKASRLDISGQSDLHRFATLIGFTLPEKQEKLDTLLSTYRKSPYLMRYEATVSSISPYDVEEVFDCSIPTAGAFDANGIYVSNCLEVMLPHRGTCLLQHVNLGALSLDYFEFIGAFEDGMKELCELHGQTGVGNTGEYLPPSIDRQVGLGILGLANLLAREGITYEQLAGALEDWRYGENYWRNLDKAHALAFLLNEGIKAAAEIARSYKMERAFAIAPTATCAYRHLDLDGYTTAPEIAPPVGRLVDRDSGTFGVEEFDYGPVETASEVGWEVYKRVANGIVRMYQDTGLFHGYSYNWWSDVVKCDEDFLRDWLQGPQTSLYYALPVMPNSQAKDDAYVALDDSFKDVLGLNEDQCSIDSQPEVCIPCSE